MTICFRVIDRGVIELNAHLAAPSFHLIGCEIGAIIGDDDVGDTIVVHNPDMKSITGPDSAVLTSLASIHLVNLSTMTNRYFFLVASSFKGSDHIEPPDHKGPSYGDCL